ncbi:class I SAM-dependent methyltransferase [Chelativorans salis]|uniref:Methyltransferase domain-containing protein n=1 Tax=Chelativorans salis TaxID=2978478 RepID=A0ABT2LQX5_9HYPH|nr:methyltransferase domain-containing protein [Chelativorans sp. EGI FJ00035]MCT7376484.1 methyltransferase domain-containing protein [Chelativorans sp. EGI FJ00035]
MSLVLYDPPRRRRCHGDTLRFLATWLRAPLRTGAVAPSSAALARTMAFAAAIRPGSRVLELGPGTGVVTKALLTAGVHEEDLILVEADAAFAGLLRQRYPAATVLEGDAFAAVSRLADAGTEFCAVVSSLPLFVFPKALRRKLALDAMRLLPPHGRLVQFTYGPISPVPREPEVTAQPSRRIWRNLPPAVVWTYQEKP